MLPKILILRLSYSHAPAPIACRGKQSVRSPEITGKRRFVRIRAPGISYPPGDCANVHVPGGGVGPFYHGKAYGYASYGIEEPEIGPARAWKLYHEPPDRSGLVIIFKNEMRHAEPWHILGSDPPTYCVFESNNLYAEAYQTNSNENKTET